jgi:hypothetical protein
VRYLLDTEFKRSDGRQRDTDWGVQGQTAAAVLRAYAVSSPGNELLAIVARLLADPETRNDVLRAALAPLADLPASDLERALTDLTARLPNPPDRVAALDRRGTLGRGAEEGEAAIELLTKDIGSGKKLIDDLNSPERGRIIRLSGDLVGVEQEGHGLYHPLWEDLLRGAPPPYALIKGVSDLADGSMRQDKSERQKRATLRALTVALAIIENFP